MPWGNWVEGQCLTPRMDSVGKCPTIAGRGEGMGNWMELTDALNFYI